MRPFRHQLAAFSPISPAVVARAFLGRSSDGFRLRLGEDLKRDFRATEAHLVDSGTHALQLAIESALAGAAGRGVVAMPAFGCFDLATAVIPTGARVIFYDMDPASLSPDPVSFRQALEQGAAAAVVTPLYGLPVDWNALEETAKSFGAPLIEDAAQGHGASWDGRPLGSLGDLSILSFSRGKGWTGGYGGAVLARGASRVLHSELRSPPSGGGTLIRLTGQWMLGRPALYGIPRSVPFLSLGETVFHEPSPVRALGDASARVLVESKEVAMAEAEARREHSAWYSTQLARSRAQLVRAVAGSRPGYLRFPVRFRGGMNALKGGERLGIAASYPILLQDLPALKGQVLSRGVFPGASELVSDLVTLPTHSRLIQADLDAIARIVA